MLLLNTLKQKIKEWAPLFASYMIHLYVNEYKNMSYLTEPDEVKYSTENYKAENDHYAEYFVRRIIVTGKKSDSINVKTMYEDFKSWFKGSRDGGRVPAQVELNKYMYERLGEPKSNKWKGYTFNNNDDDQDKEGDSDDDNEEKSSLDC